MKFRTSEFTSPFLLFLFVISFASCSNNPEPTETGKPEAMVKEDADPMTLKGVGPITSVDISGEIDAAMAEEGKKIYETKCIACHNINQKMIGPAQKGVLKRRSPEWVMNMILNPEGMLKKDPIAMKLLKEFNNVPMTNQQLREEDARKVLEYFRTVE